MTGIFLKTLFVTSLTIAGAFIYSLPEQSIVLLLGIGLTAFAVVMRYRYRRMLNREDERASA